MFAKINVDAVGSLPVTSTGKKYIIIAMRSASKYPDAVAVPDIASLMIYLRSLLMPYCKSLEEWDFLKRCSMIKEFNL